VDAGIPSTATSVAPFANAVLLIDKFIASEQMIWITTVVVITGVTYLRVVGYRAVGKLPRHAMCTYVTVR
jgi:hypothetical protein